MLLEIGWRIYLTKIPFRMKDFNTLQRFVIEKSFVNNQEITKDTRIEDDLGMTGDDAIEFIVEFGREFNIDVSSFMAADYFGPEGSPSILFMPIIRTLLGKKGEGAHKKTLTVGHLEKAIIAGRLDEDVINGSCQ
jgi:hypothetical protein